MSFLARLEEEKLKRVRSILRESGVREVYAKPIVEYLAGLSEFVEVKGALLYGSVARGKAMYRKSDVDLIVVSDDFERPYGEIFSMRRRFRGGLPGIVEALWVSPRELESMFRGFTGFVLDAVYEGVVLLDDNGFIQQLRRRLVNALMEGRAERHKRFWRIPIREVGERVTVEL